MDDASGLGGLTVADPREERRRRLDEFAQRVADEARTAPIPKASPAATVQSVVQPTAARARPAPRSPPTLAASTQTQTSTSAGSAVSSSPKPPAKFPAIIGVIVVAAVIIGVIAFINSQQNQSSQPGPQPAPYDPAIEPAPAPAVDPAAPTTEPVPDTTTTTPEVPDMTYWSADQLRSYIQNYSPGYDVAQQLLNKLEANAYQGAQGDFSALTTFVRDWPGGTYAGYAVTDLNNLIQNRRQYDNSQVWLKQSITSYRMPTYSADTVGVNGPAGPVRITGVIYNENTTWAELPITLSDGGRISVYVPRQNLSSSDPNYVAPEPAPTYTQPSYPAPSYPAPAPAPSTPSPEPSYLSLMGQWAQQPTENEFQRITGKMQIRRRMTIVVDCQVGADYYLTNCQVVEAPDNIPQRQIDGALDLAEKYVAPTWADGYQTRYKRTEITFDFRP